MTKTRVELMAEIESLKGELMMAEKAGEIVSQKLEDMRFELKMSKAWVDSALDANEALLTDLARIPRWVQWLFGVRW